MLTITGDLVTPEAVLTNGALVVDDGGQIAEIVSHRSSPPRSGDIDAAGLLVLPGFIDLHVHGGGGADFMHGTADAVRQAARTHARFGTTSLLATTLTASREATDRAISSVRQVREEGRRGDEARIAGIHLEGPYICALRRGAQPEAFVRPPDVAEFLHWVALSGQAIRQVTLAPELAGAEALVCVARREKVIVSLGHTNAKAAEVVRAVQWGATQGTHVFNAMRGIHHREPGTAGAILALPELVAEVIADGIHLHPMIVKLVLAAKGAHGAVLITDAIEGAAMPDGKYLLGGQTVYVQDGTAAFADGTLAGSVLTMNRAFINARRFADLSPVPAAKFGSTNAARQLGLAEKTGSLAVGREADIVALEPTTGAVAWTLIGGEVAFCR